MTFAGETGSFREASSTQAKGKAMTTNKPTETIRDGLLQATIWKNEAEKGSFYSAQLTRRYQDEAGNWQDSDSFSGAELLRIAQLATQAYGRIAALRRAEPPPAETAA